MHIPIHACAKPDSHPCDDSDLHGELRELPPGMYWHRRDSRIPKALSRVLCLCRVRFADGPLQDIYGTPDGHPSHEGQTARQRRSLNTSYPVDLTPHSIRMLEQELGESYRLSINRLKRRCGCVPAIAAL